MHLSGSAEMSRLSFFLQSCECLLVVILIWRWEFLKKIDKKLLQLFLFKIEYKKKTYLWKKQMSSSILNQLSVLVGLLWSDVLATTAPSLFPPDVFGSTTVEQLLLSCCLLSFRRLPPFLHFQDQIYVAHLKFTLFTFMCARVRVFYFFCTKYSLFVFFLN